MERIDRFIASSFTLFFEDVSVNYKLIPEYADLFLSYACLYRSFFRMVDFPGKAKDKIHNLAGGMIRDSLANVFLSLDLEKWGTP